MSYCGKLAAAALWAGAVAATIDVAVAQDIKLPSALTATAYDTGTSGFNIAVAVGKTLKDKYGSDLRVLPAGNDVARLQPLRGGRAQFSAMGIGLYFAQEGVFEFATKEWGPQRLRLMISSSDCNGIGFGVARDTGVRQISDLRGKRLGVVVGSPALNQNAFAYLAFGGLTPADVKLTEFSSFGAMWKGMINNDTDAAIASTITSNTREVETSPRGLLWMATPHGDAAGWARLHKIGPYFTPQVATCGSAGLSTSTPVQMAGYPYPIFMAYADQDKSLIHGVTKAMIVNYDLYKDAAPGAAGLAVGKQPFTWVLPYHDGAIQAYREAGVWTAAHDQHNAALAKRQDVLIAAWSKFIGTAPDDREAFRKAWHAARAAALVAAGMDAVFD